MLRKFLLLLLVFSSLINSFCETTDEPKVDDISEVDAAKSGDSSSEASTKAMHYRYPWEKTPEAWNTAMKIVQHKLRRKYPIDDRRGNQNMSVWYKNEVSIEAVQNITPEELNTPDYDGQQIQASIAVFIIVVKIKKVATASGGTLPAWQRFQANMQRMGVPSMAPAELGQNTVEPGKILDEDQDYFLVSVPERPFSRIGINNPMGNQLTQTVMSATLGRQVDASSQPKLNNLEVKIMFPSEKVMFMELKNSDIEALKQGQPSQRLLKQAMKNYPYAMYNPQLQSTLKEMQSSGFENQD